MKITVAICTWNRSALLDQTLTRMGDLRIPAGVEWELLIVNNNCTDETDAVIEKHRSARVLPVRRLFESKQGQVHARNHAVSEARGELLIWTDDDVLVPPGWIESYLTTAKMVPSAAYLVADSTVVRGRPTAMDGEKPQNPRTCVGVARSRIGVAEIRWG